MIRTLNLDDKARKAILERKKPVVKKEAKAKKAEPAAEAVDATEGGT
jgi:hypothetical protein